MSFTLNLGFGGLCLFVPDNDADGKEVMHVLMPAGHGHLAFLAHDLAALIGGPPTNQVLQHPLTNMHVDLSAVTTSTPLQPPPASVADLKDLSLPVPRDLLDGALSAKLTSRVTFSAGASTIDYCASGAFWKFRGVERQLPIRMVWSLEIDDTKLVVQVIGASSETFTLRPNDGVLNLWAFHLEPTAAVDTLPPRTRPKVDLKYNEIAGHFSAFFELLKSGYGNEPRFRKLEIFPGPLPCCYDTSLPGLDLTCIGATAPAVPRT